MYGQDVLINGTPSSDDASASFPVSQAVDDNDATRFSSAGGIGYGSALPHWVKYDLGAGVTKKARKLRIKAADVSGGNDIGLKDFTLQGSNDNSNWTTILTAQQAQNSNWQEYKFSNNTAYRYYMVYCTTVWQPSPANYTYMSIWEMEIMERLANGGVFINLL